MRWNRGEPALVTNHAGPNAAPSPPKSETAAPPSGCGQTCGHPIRSSLSFQTSIICVQLRSRTTSMHCYIAECRQADGGLGWICCDTVTPARLHISPHLRRCEVAVGGGMRERAFLFPSFFQAMQKKFLVRLRTRLT